MVDHAERLDRATGETLPAGTGSLETDRLAQALNWASLSLYDQRSALADSLRAITKLGGAVELVTPGSLPNDGKVIEDARTY